MGNHSFRNQTQHQHNVLFLVQIGEIIIITEQKETVLSRKIVNMSNCEKIFQPIMVNSN